MNVVLKFFAAALIMMMSANLMAQDDTPKIQVALILDTSNSMDGLINQAKSELWTVVNEMAKAQNQGEPADIEIAIYEYGNDGLEVSDGYIRLVSNFSDDLDMISEELFALKTNGGDEYCGTVISRAGSELNWSKSDKTLKVMFIAGNESFDQGDIDYKESCKTAIEKDILVNTIFCGRLEEGMRIHWKDGADIGKGSYLNIDQNEAVSYIESPFDDEITRLSAELNKTYIAYGSSGKKYKNRQTAQDVNALGSNKGVAVKRAVSKSSRVYNNSEWDLVDAVDEELVSPEELKEDQLPEEMKSMSKEERLEYINEKKQERKKIQAEIAELNKKRNKYVAEKRRESSESETLGNAIKNLVREQAEAKGFEFEDE